MSEQGKKWKVFTSSDGFTSVYVEGVDCPTAEQVGFALQGTRETIAEVHASEHANLIASAPELYETLAELLKARWMVSVDWAPSEEYQQVCDAAEAALAAARG